MATELAKAYVQIIPSAEGISGRLSQIMGGEASSAGNSAGAALGGNLIGKLKGLIAAAGIGKLLTDTITQGSDLQQSIGGIETLFKDSADTVKKYAANAYQTAGLSANEYMQSVTGFSASLLQGLGGDTAKAADVANMALTDMSDNANKMGTDMGSIQYAYQGFAKQNYTMLDNLKLGYGGTKTEMQRLLTDAQKISGVKYDMSNLSDVYSAIHVIQGQLDITGTTAKEAASTLSGSFASMKSAAQNVMAQLTLGQDAGPALQALAKTVSTFLVGNLLPAVWNILSGLPSALLTFLQTMIPQLVTGIMQFVPQLQQSIVQGAPQMLTMATQILQQLVDGFTANNGTMLKSGTDMLNGIVSGILNNLPQIVQTVSEMTGTFLYSMVDALPSILESGKSVLENLSSGIQQNLPQIIVTVGNLIATLLEALITHLPEILSAGFDLIVALIKGIGTAMPSIITAMGQVSQSIWDTLKNIDWAQLGRDMISGIIAGISAMGGALWDAAKNVANSALSSIKSTLGIHSPSTVMRDQVGKMMDAGIAEGIEQNTKPISDAMKNLSDYTTGALQAELSVQAGVTANAAAGSGYSAGRQIIVNLSPTFYGYTQSDGAALVRDLNRQLGRLSV